MFAIQVWLVEKKSEVIIITVILILFNAIVCVYTTHIVMLITLNLYGCWKSELVLVCGLVLQYCTDMHVVVE